MSTPTSTIPTPTPPPPRSDMPATVDIRGVRRHPPRAAADQRAEQVVRARLARARGAEGAAESDGGRAHRYPAGDRRQGSADGAHRAGGDAARSQARARRLSPRRTRARAAGHRRGRRGAARVGKLAMGRPRRGAAARGRTAGDDVAGDDQCGDDAGPVEDGVPGRDRCGLAR